MRHGPSFSIAVFGLGHVGLPTALGFADLGWNVIGVESDPGRCQLIKDGQDPFNEKGVASLLKKHLVSGKFLVTTDTKSAVDQANVLFMCVGTPKNKDGSANTFQLEQLAQELSASINNYKMIIQKSTAPVNTSNRIRQILLGDKKDSKNVTKKLVDIVVIPEFLREGTALEDFFSPRRIVVGVDNMQIKESIIALYRPLLEKMKKNPSEIFMFMDTRSAEITKHAANAFLATKISFINMVADLCSRVGANVETVARAIGMDSRIGKDFLQAGIGFGGECLPKDLSAFIQTGKVNGVDFAMLEEVHKINVARIGVYVTQLLQVLGSLEGRVLAIWGLTFKPGTNDIRNSQSINVLQKLVSLKAKLRVHDPYAMEEFKKLWGDCEAVSFADSPIDAAVGSHAILVLTDWPQYKEQNFQKVGEVVANPLILDGRNFLDPAALTACGFKYCGMGR